MRSAHSRISLGDILSRSVALDLFGLFMSENTLLALVGWRWNRLSVRVRYFWYSLRYRGQSHWQILGRFQMCRKAVAAQTCMNVDDNNFSELYQPTRNTVAPKQPWLRLIKVDYGKMTFFGPLTIIFVWYYCYLTFQRHLVLLIVVSYQTVCKNGSVSQGML